MIAPLAKVLVCPENIAPRMVDNKQNMRYGVSQSLHPQTVSTRATAVVLLVSPSRRVDIGKPTDVFISWPIYSGTEGRIAQWIGSRRIGMEGESP
jgi:hypothetical protein